jgi:virginiamycin A acetyltransferase
VAARSVVVTDVKPYTVVGGNPAKPIKERFAPEIVRELLQIAWWDWSIEKVTRNLQHIVSADIKALSRAS